MNSDVVCAYELLESIEAFQKQMEEDDKNREHAEKLCLIAYGYARKPDGSDDRMSFFSQRQPKPARQIANSYYAYAGMGPPTGLARIQRDWDR